MRTYQARDHLSNSAAGSLPASFWRTKFRCGQRRHNHTKVLVMFVFWPMTETLGAAKQISSLRSGRRLFGGGEVGALPTQFGDPLAGVEIGPVDECEVGDLARVVGAVGDADLLAGDVHRTDPALVLQPSDVAERREIERNEIGSPARFEHADAVALGHKAGIDLGRRAQCRGRGEAQILDKELEL